MTQLLRDLGVYPDKIYYRGQVFKKSVENGIVIRYINKRHISLDNLYYPTLWDFAGPASAITFPKKDFWELVDGGIICVIV